MKESATPSSKPQPLLGALRALGTAIVLLVILDVLLGLVKPTPGSPLYQSDPQLFWRLRSNVHDYEQRSQEASDERTVTHISTSSLGIRNEELPRKSIDEFRILVMGDSSIFGHGVGLPQTFEKQLEALLKPRFPTLKVRVVNGGVSGYSTFQGRLWFHELAPAVQPDLVVFGFYFSDFIPDLMRDSSRLPPGSATSPFMRMLGRSNLYQFLRDELEKQLSNESLASGGQTLTARVTPAEYSDNLSAMLDEAERMHAKCMLLLLTPRAVPIPAEQKPYREAMQALARTRQIPLVDMDGPFAKAANRSTLFIDEVHPSADGDAVIARTLEDALLTSHAFPIPPR